MINRCTSRPRPGKPLAKVVKSRCKEENNLFGRVRYYQRGENSRKSEAAP